MLEGIPVEIHASALHCKKRNKILYSLSPVNRTDVFSK